MDSNKQISRCHCKLMLTQYALWGQMPMCIHENWTNKNTMQTGYNKYFCDKLRNSILCRYDHN